MGERKNLLIDSHFEHLDLLLQKSHRFLLFLDELFGNVSEDVFEDAQDDGLVLLFEEREVLVGFFVLLNDVEDESGLFLFTDGDLESREQILLQKLHQVVVCDELQLEVLVELVFQFAPIEVREQETDLDFLQNFEYFFLLYSPALQLLD